MSWLYSLSFNRDILIRLKPIACEIACALFQSLDNIIGVAAREAGVKRGPSISWPWAIEDDPGAVPLGGKRPAITAKLQDLRRKGLPEQWLAMIEDTFAAPAIGLVHIDVVKEVSISGKHWELVPTGADAIAIAWTPLGSIQQEHAAIPPGYFKGSDEFIFHEGAAINGQHFMAIIGTRLLAGSKTFQPEPIAAFEYTSRFVATALQKARML